MSKLVKDLNNQIDPMGCLRIHLCEICFHFVTVYLMYGLSS